MKDMMTLEEKKALIEQLQLEVDAAETIVDIVTDCISQLTNHKNNYTNGSRFVGYEEEHSKSTWSGELLWVDTTNSYKTILDSDYRALNDEAKAMYAPYHRAIYEDYVKADDELSPNDKRYIKAYDTVIEALRELM